MKIKVYYLSYCGHCKNLMDSLDASNISYEKQDADDDIEEMNSLEASLETREYPIVEVIDGLEVIYYISDNLPLTKIKEGIFKEGYSTIDSLVFKIKNL
jgi:arsenate reductase-like glutaredoxin family protein